jgi:hypothetical protein
MMNGTFGIEAGSRPFRASSVWRTETQGVALGYDIAAFLAARKAGDN